MPTAVIFRGIFYFLVYSTATSVLGLLTQTKGGMEGNRRRTEVGEESSTAISTTTHGTCYLACSIHRQNFFGSVAAIRDGGGTVLNSAEQEGEAAVITVVTLQHAAYERSRACRVCLLLQRSATSGPRSRLNE
jgi:hypothetical protein